MPDEGPEIRFARLRLPPSVSRSAFFEAPHPAGRPLRGALGAADHAGWNCMGRAAAVERAARGPDASGSTRESRSTRGFRDSPVLEDRIG
jgi:hypothetical protein